MNSSDRQLLILIAGVVFILVQALAINYKIWWLTFTASGMALLFAAFLPRAAALPTSKNDRPKAEDLAYGDVPTTEFTSTSLASTSGALFPLAKEEDIHGLPMSSLKGRHSERITGDDPDVTASFLHPLRLKTPRPSRN